MTKRTLAALALATALTLAACQATAAEAPADTQAAPAAAHATIQLLALARVHAPQIELGEVAQISCQDALLRERLEQIDLGRAPWPGYRRSLEKAWITDSLAQAQVQPGEVKVDGADTVSVETLSTVVPGERLVSLAQDHILENMPWSQDEVNLEFTRFPRSITVPEGKDLDFTVTCVTPNSAYIGNVQLSIGIKVDNKVYKTVPATIKVRVFKDVLISTGRIKRHQPLEGSVEVQRREITYLSGTPVTDMDAAASLRARMSIAGNTIIRENMLEEIPAVLKGDEVRVVYDNNGLKIETKAVARENGRVGDSIKVLNTDSNKVLYVTVLDASGTTQLHL